MREGIPLMSDAPANGNGHKWVSNVLSGAIGMAIFGALGVGYQIAQASWKAAEIITKMDSRIEQVERGLHAVKTDVAAVRDHLLLPATASAKAAEPKRAVIRPPGRAQAP